MAHAPQALIRPVLMSFVTTALGPDPGLFKAGGALVNRLGVRFGNEFDKPALALAMQPDGIGYIVLDSAMARQFTAWPHFVSTAPNVAHAYLPDYRGSRPDMYHEAASVTALAEKLGMDARSLEAALASGGPSGVPVDKPPFVALGPVKSYMVLTDGGLKVSERHEVIGEGDRPISGLFAAGSAGQGGVLLYGHGHHLGWAFVSGRRAGRHAAQSAAA
jgi:fumarate reductase flavoprotein subunit